MSKLGNPVFYFIASKFRYVNVYVHHHYANSYILELSRSVVFVVQAMAFYGALVSVSVCRGDQLSVSHQLLYHVMTILKSCTDKSFEIVLDLTQATQLNEPDVRLFGNYNKTFYFLCGLSHSL